MALNGDRPELRALAQLEEVLALVADELAAWRTRALKAEQDLSGLLERMRGDGAEGDPGSLAGRLAALEAENRDLTERVNAAKARVSELLQRLMFLEQQSLEESRGAR